MIAKTDGCCFVAALGPTLARLTLLVALGAVFRTALARRPLGPLLRTVLGTMLARRTFPVLL
ncbi:MAG: hypothetical protein ACXWLB_24870, partial [Reyranella sp.]